MYVYRCNQQIGQKHFSMDIDVFFRNDDLSFGADGSKCACGSCDSCSFVGTGQNVGSQNGIGNFARRTQFGFKDDIYTQFVSNKRAVTALYNDLNDGGYQNFVKNYANSLTSNQKKDCDFLKSVVSEIDNLLVSKRKAVVQARGKRKNALQEDVNKLFSEKSKIEALIAEIDCGSQEELEFQQQLMAASQTKSNLGKIALIGGALIMVIGVVFMVIKKNKKK